MTNYQPLVARAVANLQSTGTVAARHAIYERLRKAQLAQLGTLRPPLAESEIAREKEALDQAIALIEAQFHGTMELPLAATTPAARTNAAGTEVSIPSLPRLARLQFALLQSQRRARFARVLRLLPHVQEVLMEQPRTPAPRG